MRISDWSSDVCSSDLPGDKIGVVIAMESGDVEIARDLAMHIAAMSPRFLDAKAVSADAIDSERKIIEAIVAQEQIDRSEERRVGKECVGTCRSRWSTYP